MVLNHQITHKNYWFLENNSIIQYSQKYLKILTCTTNILKMIQKFKRFSFNPFNLMKSKNSRSPLHNTFFFRPFPVKLIPLFRPFPFLPENHLTIERQLSRQ